MACEWTTARFNPGRAQSISLLAGDTMVLAGPDSWAFTTSFGLKISSELWKGTSSCRRFSWSVVVSGDVENP